MNKPRSASPLNALIRAEASEWLVRFSEGEIDAEGREAFSAWLRTSPEHVRTYLRVSAFWQEAAKLDGRQAPRDIDALIARAKAGINVFPLTFGSQLPTDAGAVDKGSVPTSESDVANAAMSGNGKRLKRFALAASVLVALGALGTYQYFQRGVYRTDIGEQRVVNLPDGSTMTLNADSGVKVRFSGHDRTIELDQGQALFKVAKDATRPFIVRSGEASVRAVGTQFDVYRKLSGTTVTVVEGSVAVVAGAAATVPMAERLLSAGEQVTVTPLPRIAPAPDVAPKVPPPEVRPVNARKVTAWTEGLLVFEGIPLREVIQEFNRQNTKPLVLDSSAALADLRISGTFPASGSERIVRFLEERFGVSVQETNDAIRLSLP